jgi:hypothetical protein
MKSIMRTLVVPLIVIGAIGAHTVAAGTPVASAEPYVGALTDPIVTPPINWTQMGLSERVDVIGSNQPVDTAVPVPAGVGPMLLTGQIGSVVNVTAGRIDVFDGRGILLGTLGVPADVATLPFALDISAAQVTDGKAPLSFVLRDSKPTADGCSQPPSLSLTQLATTFSGPIPDPVTVGDFLPGYLDEIVIRVGSAPTQSQQQAALDLVAALTHMYRPMPVRIEVITSDGPAQVLSSSRRVIDIRDGGRAGVTVENPGTPEAMLLVTGTGDELVRQVDLFADRRVGLAQTSSAITLSAREDVAQSTNIKTFGQLGMTGQASVLGSATMYAGFDVSAFGVGPISNATVHLKARYTPVTGGEASVLVRSGSAVVFTHKLDESGVLDVTGDIPAESITSNVGMALELRYVPRQECAPMNDRMTFALDPQSTVAVTPGTHNRGGFPVLPMAFTPDFDVTVDSPDHIGYATQAINLMGQQTTVTLRPHLTTFDAAAGSATGLLAVTSGDQLTKAGMSPPLRPDNANTVGINGSTDTNVDLNGALGVVQAFTNNGRTVLAVSGAGDWSLVNRTFDYIRAQRNRWGSLSGDVVATGAAGKTVNLTLREGGGLVNEYPGDGWKWWAWLTLALGIASVLAAVGFAIIRRRRVRR